jgi:hypothetical protein
MSCKLDILHAWPFPLDKPRSATAAVALHQGLRVGFTPAGGAKVKAKRHPYESQVTSFATRMLCVHNYQPPAPQQMMMWLVQRATTP